MYEAKCKGCTWKCAAASVGLFGIAIRHHELVTGHTIKIKEA